MGKRSLSDVATNDSFLRLIRPEIENRYRISLSQDALPVMGSQALCQTCNATGGEAGNLVEAVQWDVREKGTGETIFFLTFRCNDCGKVYLSEA